MSADDARAARAVVEIASMRQFIYTQDGGVKILHRADCRLGYDGGVACSFRGPVGPVTPARALARPGARAKEEGMAVPTFSRPCVPTPTPNA